MSRPSDIKKVFLQFCAERGDKPEKLREAEAVELLRSFYDEVGFDGRQRGTQDDKLLFETLNTASDDRWMSRVTRQLYKHGRGVRLSLTWVYESPSFLANITVDSGSDSSATWASEALKEVDSINVGHQKPASFEIVLDTL